MDAPLNSGTGSRRGAVARRSLSALRVLGTVTAAAATLVFLAVGVVAPLLHVGFSPVLTGSMRPAYAPGDLLITVPARTGVSSFLCKGPVGCPVCRF
ncbi:hypothetical protein AB0299_17350, partial [Pseudarthrobacter sp. NPDC080037]